MHRLYVLISILAVPVVALVLLWKGLGNRAYLQRFEERFGFGASRLDRPGLWVHAVSVGEVVAASALVRELRRRHPDLPMVVTTVTPTGAERVADLFGGDVLHAYAPFDSPGSVRRFFARMKPRLVVIMETELWPNLYAECGRRGTPLVLANARISPRSVERYQRFRGLFARALSHGVVIGAQSERDAERFRCLGADGDRVHVTGNLKADVEAPPEVAAAGQAFRASHAAGRPVWIAASTHEGEEAAVLDAHERIRASVPDALLLLVPRHPPRFEAVAELLASRDAAWSRRSVQGVPGPGDAVFLVDTLGELMMFYAASDVAFVAGSLVPIGGHNCLEPASLGKPVIAGPHNFNAEDLAALLVEAGGMRIVADAVALAEAVAGLLQDEAARLDQGRLAREAVAANRGALGRLMGLIEPHLDEPRASDPSPRRVS